MSYSTIISSINSINIFVLALFDTAISIQVKRDNVF